MPIKAWSTTASSNATADSASGIVWSEGQAPSSVNDSARAMMAELAEYFKDNDGTLTTAGTSTAYTATGNGSFTSLADGLKLSITADKTCGASPTLNVSSLGAKKFRKFINGVEQDLASGDLVANGHYSIEYDSAANGSSGAWIVLNPAFPSGSVLSYAYQEYTTNANLTTTIPSDDTVPLSTEGTQILSISLTPTTTSDIVELSFSGWGSVGSVADLIVAVFRGTTCINARAVTVRNASDAYLLDIPPFIDSPATTSATTYSVRVGPTTGTARLNGDEASRFFGGISRCVLVGKVRRA